MLGSGTVVAEIRKTSLGFAELLRLNCAVVYDPLGEPLTCIRTWTYNELLPSKLIGSVLL